MENDDVSRDALGVELMHAQLLAEASRLIAECGHAAAAINAPLADGAGARVDRMPLVALADTAAKRLDAARDADGKRRVGGPAPTGDVRRRLLAQAEHLVTDEETDTGATAPRGAEPTPAQWAALGTAAAGPDILNAVTASAESALGLLGELAADDAPDERPSAAALDSAAAAVCLTLRAAAAEQAPAAAADGALRAARQLLHLVDLATLPEGGR